MYGFLLTTTPRFLIPPWVGSPVYTWRMICAPDWSWLGVSPLQVPAGLTPGLHQREEDRRCISFTSHRLASTRYIILLIVNETSPLLSALVETGLKCIKISSLLLMEMYRFILYIQARLHNIMLRIDIWWMEGVLSKIIDFASEADLEAVHREMTLKDNVSRMISECS